MLSLLLEDFLSAQEVVDGLSRGGKFVDSGVKRIGEEEEEEVL